MKKFSLIIVLTVLLSACKTTPYAIIDGSQSKVTSQHSYDVIISGIDGTMYFGGLKTKNVEPGPHRVQLTSTKQERRNDVSYLSWYFNAKPCMKYIVAAKHANEKRFSNDQWEVEVLRVEPIKSCVLPKDSKETKTGPE